MKEIIKKLENSGRNINEVVKSLIIKREFENAVDVILNSIKSWFLRILNLF